MTSATKANIYALCASGPSHPSTCSLFARAVDVQWQALCRFRLSQDELRQFSEAIKEHYIFELFVGASMCCHDLEHAFHVISLLCACRCLLSPTCCLRADDLPVKGFVGEVEQSSVRFDSHVHNESHVYLFTHLDFSLAYNGDSVRPAPLSPYRPSAALFFNRFLFRSRRTCLFVFVFFLVCVAVALFALHAPSSMCSLIFDSFCGRSSR